MKTMIFFFALIFLLGFTGYGKEPIKLKYPSLIFQAGTLASKDGTLIAKVETTDDIVHIFIVDKKTNKILIQAISGNVFHRWYLSWDTNNKLWNWNSDIGGDLFEIKEGKWIRNKTPNYKEAPKAFQDDLPSTVKKKLKI
jgi:hypothetical protein